MFTNTPPENRFAEVTRKAREARARLNENQRVREANERRVPRDRDYVAVEPDEPAPASSGTSATSAVDRASAALDGHEKPKP